MSITLDVHATEFREIAATRTGGRDIEPVFWAEGVENKVFNKFEAYLPGKLLAQDHAIREFDVAGALAPLRRMMVRP